MSVPSPAVYLLLLLWVSSPAHCISRIQHALENLRMLTKEHGTHANLIFDLEQQLKDSGKVRR